MTKNIKKRKVILEKLALGLPPVTEEVPPQLKQEAEQALLQIVDQTAEEIGNQLDSLIEKELAF